jgi:hypothetical protein
MEFEKFESELQEVMTKYGLASIGVSAIFKPAESEGQRMIGLFIMKEGIAETTGMRVHRLAFQLQMKAVKSHPDAETLTEQHTIFPKRKSNL